MVNLTRGGLSGGYVKYLKTLVPLLETDKRISELAVFVPFQAQRQFADSGLTVRSWESGATGLRRSVQAFRPGVVFIPSARWIDFGGVPSAVMVRNMEPLVVPCKGNPVVECIKNLARRRAARRACIRANKVVAVSSFVQSFIETKWKIDHSKIHVIYHGVDPSLPADETSRPSAVPGDFDRPFVFTAGSIRRARGLEDIVTALALVKRTRECFLVIAGAPTGGGTYKQQIQAMAERLGITRNIVWAGQLTPMEMSWCYRRCAVHVTTSRVEACPNVVLEALAHGCVSISTDSPPMPEFFEKSALYYPACDAAALAKQLMRALQNGDEFASLKYLALARSQRFTWHETARKTADLLVNLSSERAMVR